MTKKMAVIAIEFDDPEGSYLDGTDLATDVEMILGQAGFKGLDVTVYPTPAELAADTADGVGIFAEGRPDAGEVLSAPARADTPTA